MRVAGGRRIEQQPRRRQEVPGLCDELRVEAPFGRVGAESREQGLGATQVLCRREAIRDPHTRLRPFNLWKRGSDLLRRARAPQPADRDADEQHGGHAQTPAPGRPQHDDPRRGAPPPPLGFDGRPHLFPRRFRWPVIVLPRLAYHCFEPIVVVHDAHSPAKSANASRSRARARDNCALEVPTSTFSVAAISSCVYPSTSCITTTVRYFSGNASIAARNRDFKSGSAVRWLVVTASAASRTVSRARNRFVLRNPFSATDVAIACSQVENRDSPRNVSSRWNARMNVSCVKSLASSSSPAIR